MFARSPLAEVLRARITVLSAGFIRRGRMAALTQATFIVGAKIAIIRTRFPAQIRMFTLTSAAIVIRATVAIVLAWLEIRGRRMATFSQQAHILRTRITVF